MPEAVAELKQVEVAYRGCRVFGPLTLTIQRGDVVGVVGPNGAGKSTLLRVLAGIQQPTQGSLRLLGQCPARRPWRWALPDWQRRIGLLFQHHEFCADVPLTVRDVVSFGLLARRRGYLPRCRDEDAQVVQEALRRLGIEALAQRLYRELSGGERQKAQVARLLAQAPDLVLLDEPTAGLDLDARERVTRLAADLRRDHGLTVVMVTHEVDRLPGNCTLLVLLPLGQAPRVGPPEELLAAGPLSQAYGCAVEVVRHGRRVLAFAPLDDVPP
jgi:ABC-type cobalamin/Fe3+-siderophores transport system ATPase subunit